MKANEIITRIRKACDAIYEKYEGNPMIEKDDILAPLEDIIVDYYEDLSPMFEEAVEHSNILEQEELVSKELEKAAVEAFKKIVDSDKNNFLEIFKAGAEWKEKQMMKNAVDAKITLLNGISYVDKKVLAKYNSGDKVKVIIIKED